MGETWAPIKNVKHICDGNPECKKAEYCPTAIEATTLDDLAEETMRYVRGRGECEPEVN